jgi:CRP-like cAMP-binding protein
MEDWWIGDMYSFLSGNPSAFNIDCLEDTEVLQITKPNLDQLYNEVPKMNQYFRLLLEKALITTNQRIIASLRKTAAERYLEFLEKYPHIDQRVSNHQIASFLGITPQSLSRVRRELSR